jgi:hypothetical protein
VTSLGMEPVRPGTEPARYQVAVEFPVADAAKLRAGAPATLNLP